MAPETWRQHWVNEKCQVAIRLSQGEAGGSYAEAVIVVCAAISALAAEVWNGTGIDKVRFVELLVQLGSQSEICSTISTPLLVEHLRNTSREAEAKSLCNAFSLPASARVLTGPDVDKSEKKILDICPQLDYEELRRFSYASLLYDEIRSSYAHEYRPGQRADSWPMTALPNQIVSYINRLSDDHTMRRLIHFHLEWLTSIPIELARIIDSMAPELPHPKPSMWWARGG